VGKLDDLTQKLSELLSSPDSLQKLQAAAASLGMLTGNKSDNQSAVPASTAPAIDTSGISSSDFETIRKIMPLLSGFRQDDQHTILLKALRPYLQEERRRRVDDAVKIMHMLKMLPHLKDKGIF